MAEPTKGHVAIPAVCNSLSTHSNPQRRADQVAAEDPVKRPTLSMDSKWEPSSQQVSLPLNHSY